MSKKRKNKKIKKLRKIFQQKIASHKEELLEEVKIEKNINKETAKVGNSNEKKPKYFENFNFEKNKLKSNLESSLKKFKERISENIEKLRDKKIEKDTEKKTEAISVKSASGDSQKLKDIRILWEEISNKIIFKRKEATGKIKILYLKIVGFLKKWNNIFCTGMTCRVNIKRDIIITGVAILVAVIFLGMGQYIAAIKSRIQDKQNSIVVQDDVANQFEEENVNEIKVIQDQISTENWKEYKSEWYGFKIKYPQDWKTPTASAYKKGSLADYRVTFVSNKQENKNIIGFEVAIYSVNRIKELSLTSEFPKIKNMQLKTEGKCEALEGHILETGDYPAEEIYIPVTDDCYNPVLFFSVTDGQYLYNILPIAASSINLEADPMVELSDNLPEFFVAVSQFENIDIVRPKPVPVKPKITAPKPASYKVVNGRMVCEKKNDKPSKSDKNKKKHMDMECCLDPDEYPNPNCYYDAAKYGKYLK